MDAIGAAALPVSFIFRVAVLLLVLVALAADEAEDDDEEAAAASEASGESGLRSPCIVEQVSLEVVVLLLPLLLVLTTVVALEGSSSREIVGLVRVKKSAGQGAMVGSCK